jgi:hypothetical protein
VAELVLKEGEVRLTATGLPVLEGEEYGLWLVKTQTGEHLLVSTFNSAPGQVARVETVLDDARPDQGWNLLLITVENDATSRAEPASRHSIAGRFPVPDNARGPAELPKTGGEPPASQPSELVVGVLGMAVGGGVATAAWKWRPRRIAR